MDIEGSEFDALLSTRVEVLRKIARMDIEIHNHTAQGYSFDNRRYHLKQAGRTLTSLETDAQGFAQARFARAA